MPEPGQLTTAAAVALACQDLTNLELAALFNAATFPGYNPRHLLFYEKVAHLFTEDEETQMHGDVLDALSTIVRVRLTDNENT